MTTQSDVARQVGVSRSTVCEVLRGNPHVAEETRGRVLDAVEALGYRAEGPARQLVTARHDAIPHRRRKVAIDFILRTKGFPDERGNAFKEACEAFQRSQDRIRVVVRYLRLTAAQYMYQLLTDFASRPTPSLAGVSWDYFERLASMKLCRDLTDQIVSFGWDRLFEPEALDMFQVDGRLLGVPVPYSYVPVITFLKSHVTSAGLDASRGPRTWEEFIEWAKRLTDPSRNRYGINLSQTNEWAHLLADLIRQRGSEVSVRDEQGEWRLNLNTPEGEDALVFLKDLRWRHNVVDPVVYAWGDVPARKLAEHQIGMLVGPPQATLLEKTGVPRHDISLVPLPSGPVRTIWELSAGAWVVNPRGTSAQVEASCEFINYLVRSGAPGKSGFSEASARIIHPDHPLSTPYPSDWPRQWIDTLTYARLHARPLRWHLGYEPEILERLVLLAMIDPEIDPDLVLGHAQSGASFDREWPRGGEIA